jgi:hypothetical protein
MTSERRPPGSGCAASDLGLALELFENREFEPLAEYVNARTGVVGNRIVGHGVSELLPVMLAYWGRSFAPSSLPLLDQLVQQSQGADRDYLRLIRALAQERVEIQNHAVEAMARLVSAEPPAGAGSGAIVSTTGARPESLRRVLEGYRCETGFLPTIFFNGALDPPEDLRPYLILPPDGPLYFLIKKLLRPGQRFAVDFYRALAAGDGDLLWIEDDVDFCRGWKAALDAALAEVGARDDLGLLTLFRWSKTVLPWAECTNSQAQIEGNAGPIPFDEYAGTQAVWFPGRTRRKLRQALRPHIFERYQMPLDLLLRPAFRALGLKIYATRYSLLQHSAPDGQGATSQGQRSYTLELLGETHHG